jgi:hypothetical protein
MLGTFKGMQGTFSVIQGTLSMFITIVIINKRLHYKNPYHSMREYQHTLPVIKS